MDRVKKTIILLIILLSVILLVLLILKNNKNDIDVETGMIYEENSVLEFDENIKDVTNYKSYTTVVNVLEKYLNPAEDLENYEDEKAKIELEEVKYIEEEVIAVYFVYGKVDNQERYFIISLDNVNKTFKVDDIDKAKYSEIIKNGYENKIEKIDKSGSNAVVYINKLEQDICMNYLMMYKKKLRNNVEVAYELLDEEYRENRFPTLEDFRNYVLNNSDVINKATVSNYKVNYCNGYTQYICQDQYNNYYIFNATAVLKYKVLLDTYTIPIQEYEEYYENATDEYKVVYNIQNFFNAINSKDYKYAYKVLDETFRTNNFGSVDNFSKYVNQNFYEHNEIIEFTYKIDQDLYICSVTLKDLTNNSTQELEKTIIMQLKENSKFVISFNI